MWLYSAREPRRGVFRGSFVEFGIDYSGPERWEFSDSTGQPLDVTHFWEGKGEPAWRPGAARSI